MVWFDFTGMRVYREKQLINDKQAKHIEKKDVQKLSAALQEELNVPVLARVSNGSKRQFDLQISYTDGRKVNVRSTDEGASCFWGLLDKAVNKELNEKVNSI